MSEQPRDWDRELAAVDKVIDQQGSATVGQGGRPVPSGTAPVPVPAGGAPVRRRSVALTWFWVILAVAMAVALPLWPYPRECGLQLFFYLGAAAVTLIVGIVGAVSSWASQRGIAHLLALLVVGSVAVMAAREVLPRTGYAREARTWTCPSAPEPAPAPGPPSGPAPAAPQ